MDIKNNTLTIGGKTTTLTPEQMKDLGIEVGGRKRAELGQSYYYLSNRNEVVSTTDFYNEIHNELYDIGNHFLTEAECHAEKMRVESARARWDFVPKKGEDIWYWSFNNNKPFSGIFDSICLNEWNIGAVHRTKRECRAWGAKYAQYFHLPN